MLEMVSCEHYQKQTFGGSNLFSSGDKAGEKRSRINRLTFLLLSKMCEVSPPFRDGSRLKRPRIGGRRTWCLSRGNSSKNAGEIQFRGGYIVVTGR